MKGKVYVVKGVDMYGKLMTETITLPIPTFKDKLRAFAIRIIGMRLASRLGLTNFKYISGVKVNNETR